MNSWLYRLHDTYCICASAYCVYSDNVSMSDDDEQDYHYRRFEDEDKDSATNETQSAADDRHEERGAASVNGTSNGHKNIDNKRKKTVHHELKVMDVRGSDSTSTETFSSSTNGDQGFDREKPWIADAFQGHHCPICLGATEESTIIESCRHIFCKSCLFKWLAVSDRCPLCKTPVTSVLHDIKSPKEFKVHVHDSATPGASVADVCDRGDEGKGMSRGGSGGVKGTEFRSVVYRRGYAAEPPEPRARRPKAVHELRVWIRREVEAATSAKAPSGIFTTAGEAYVRGGDMGGIDTRLVVDVLEALLKENDMDEQEGYCRVKGQLNDFMFENTGLFLHELWCFRWSKLGMTAYDRDTVYNVTPSSI